MKKRTQNHELSDRSFSSAELLQTENSLVFSNLDSFAVINVGKLALEFGLLRKLSIAIEIRIGDWTVFHASLPGSSPENDWWMNRKARVVMKTGHSSLYERVLAEENGIDWFAQHGVSEDEYAIHGGGLPINVKGEGLVGVLLISGLPQVQDHLLGVEILTEFLARKGETV
jgi:uncharacterized protein (UPF0303 family)